MQTIGLIGGMTPQSTMLYYEILNFLSNKKFGGSHSCKQIIYSLDFETISGLQKENRWDMLNDIIADAGKSLEAAGAGLIIICANTMHLCIDAIKAVVNVPVIHIAEATAMKIKKKGLKKVALLGTKYTMEKNFFKKILESFGIETIIPNEADRDTCHKIIYKELSKGLLLKESKMAYLDIMDAMIKDGAQGIILGCTEIPLLIKQCDVDVPVFDTTTIHAREAFKQAMKTKL